MDDLEQTGLYDFSEEQPEQPEQEQGQPQGITREQLMQDLDFLEDAQGFIQERHSQILTDPEEITNKFLEHFNVSAVNELAAARDLYHARSISPESQDRMRRLLDTYDQTDTEWFSSRATGDVLEGLAGAPSTYLGILTGGVGKAGSQAAITGARTALKALLTRQGAAAGATRGALAEGALGGLHGGLESKTREKLGTQEEGAGVVSSALLGAGVGSVLGGASGYLRGRGGDKAQELLTEARVNTEARQSVQKAKAKKTMEQLRALTPKYVEAGNKILDDLNKSEPLKGVLTQSAMEAVSSSVLSLAREGNIKLNNVDRVTESVFEAIRDGRLSTDQVMKTINEHGLSRDEFAYSYMATLSEAGRTLGRAGQLKKALKAMGTDSPLNLSDDQVRMLDGLDEQKTGKVLETLRAVDRLRLASMTSQLATTSRNIQGAGFRVFMDALDEGVQQGINALSGKPVQPRSALTLLEYMTYKQDIADVTRTMLTEQMPLEAQRLFFDAAVVEARVGRATGANKVMGDVGNAINIANTVSDMVFKRAALAANLERYLKAEGTDLVSVIKTGQFNRIPEDVIKKSVDESLYFAYQKMPERGTFFGDLGTGIVDLHRKVPFLVSAFVPFPRFVINQTRFFVEHAPILGYIANRVGTKGTENILAKQVSGSILLGTAAMIAYNKDESDTADQFTTSDGSYVDLSSTYGPLYPYMIAGDTIAKHFKNKHARERGEPEPFIIDTAATEVLRDTLESLEALGTPRFNQFSGISSISESIKGSGTERDQQAVGKFLGDFLSTYTIPVAMIRDFSSIGIEDQVFIREMDDYLESSPTGEVNFFEYMMHYASKNTNWILEPEIEDTNIGQYEGPVSVGKRMYSPTQGRLVRLNPLERQLGITRYAPKSELQKEMDRLGMRRNDLFPTDRDPIRQHLREVYIGELLPNQIEAFIKSDDYQSLDAIDRRDELTAEVRRVLSDELYSNEMVEEIMSEMVINDRQVEYSHLDRAEYLDLSDRDRSKIERIWEEEGLADLYGGRSLAETGAFRWALDNKDRLLDRKLR